jgi:DNA gyrase inhibitor GyrI
MGVLLERRAQLIFVTASVLKENGRAGEVIVESRPQYAVVQLRGCNEKYSIAWEAIYKMAKKKHARKLRLEARAIGRKESAHQRKTA